MPYVHIWKQTLFVYVGSGFIRRRTLELHASVDVIVLIRKLRVGCWAVINRFLKLSSHQWRLVDKFCKSLHCWGITSVSFRSVAWCRRQCNTRCCTDDTPAAAFHLSDCKYVQSNRSLKYRRHRTAYISTWHCRERCQCEPPNDICFWRLYCNRHTFSVWVGLGRVCCQYASWEPLRMKIFGHSMCRDVADSHGQLWCDSSICLRWGRCCCKLCTSLLCCRWK